jgi:outer membrane protein assembly factor BamE (lipoprotein component of BamABCDE complex)
MSVYLARSGNFHLILIFSLDIMRQKNPGKAMKRIFCSLLCILALNGCYYTLQSIQGAKVSSAQIQEIKLGKSTEADLLKLLGPPTKKEHTLSGNERLTYLSTRTESLTFIGGYVAKGVLDREQQEGFEVILRDGIVQSYRYLKPE